MALRPYWSGQIRLSLVSLPVDIFPALNRSRQMPLHEIYRKTGERVHHQNVAGDKIIEREDIVKGYEVEKGEYVILEPDEIKDLKIPSSETLDIVQFVNAEAIGQIYYESPYFVVPDGKAATQAFAVIREALRDTGKVGLGQLAIAGRERLCAIRPCGSGMLLETLRYKDEVRESDPYFDEIGKSSIDKDQLTLAKELIKKKTSTFKPETFHDHYKEALKELIEAKQQHRKVAPVKEEKSSGKVINLMDALRKSLKDKGVKAKPARAAKKKPAAKPRKATKPRKRA